MVGYWEKIGSMAEGMGLKVALCQHVLAMQPMHAQWQSHQTAGGRTCHVLMRWPSVIAGSGALQGVMAAWQQAPVAGTLSQKVCGHLFRPLLMTHDLMVCPFQVMWK